MTEVFWIINIFLLAIPCVCQNETVFITSSACKNRVIKSSYVTRAMHTVSELECSRECAQHESCLTFSVRAGFCEMSDTWINDNCTDGYTDAMQDSCVYSLKNPCENNGYIVDGICWCVGGFAGDYCESIVQDCSEAGLYPYYANKELNLQIKPVESASPFLVHCNTKQIPGRTNIFTRSNNDTNFNRGWSSYKTGFGVIGEIEGHTDFWIGLENMHVMTKSRKYRLRVRACGDINYIQFYHNFTVSGEDTNYTMDYSNTSPGVNPIGDSFILSKGMPFSTYDKDSTPNNCPVSFGSGWWFSTSNTGNCSNCNPTGFLGKSPTFERLGTDQEVFFDTLGNWAPSRVNFILEYDL